MNRFKAKKFCVKVFKRLKRKKKQLPAYQCIELQEQLHKSLETLDLKGRSYRKEIEKLECLYKRILPISLTRRTIEWFAGLIFALFFALVLRSMLFEPYKIPSGSMRPTLKEKDLVLVDKSHFGINMPFVNRHFLFNQNLVNRLGITVFSGFDLDILNNRMMYFFILPGVKQYIKRVMAKPGDCIYFYGGKLWGVDRDGNDLVELRDSSTAKSLTWVPYIYLDGQKKRLELKKGEPELGFFQMNIPTLKASVNKEGSILSEFFNGSCWSMNVTPSNYELKDYPTQYRDLWGLGNYATVRLLTVDEKEKACAEIQTSFEHLLYMEISSIPSIASKSWSIFQGKLPILIPNRSFIPLSQKHLFSLMENMYTARFVVSKGHAYRYDLFQRNGYHQGESGIKMAALKDGVYEFEKGSCYEIRGTGDRKKLPGYHDVYTASPENVLNLFNFGINFNKDELNTMRYSFYNMGELYALNAPLFPKEDSYLKEYVKDQLSIESGKTRESSFYPFVDSGPPIKEGKIDVEFVKAFGLAVPEGAYLLMGDNYAMSSDSRDFGVIKEGNLRGSASMIFWPFSNFGFPFQPSSAWLTYPKVMIWFITIFAFSVYSYSRRVCLKRELRKIEEDEGLKSGKGK